MAFEKFEKYFVGRKVPEDYFPVSEKYELILMPIITFLSIFGFLLLMIFDFNAYMKIGIIFSIMGLLAMQFNFAEILKPRGSLWGESSTLAGTYGALKSTAIGLGIGLMFLFPSVISTLQVGSVLFSGVVTMETSGAANTLFSGLLITGILIPVVENSLYAKYMVPWFWELGGRLKMAGAIGLFVPALLFSASHYGAYGLVINALVWIFMFRFVTSLSIIETKSFLPALVAHMIYNSGLVLLMFGVI